MKKIPKLFKKLTALTMAICMSVMGTSVVGGEINEVKAYHPTQESEIAKAKRSYRNAARENGYSITIKYKIIVGDDFVTVVPTIDKKKYTRNGKSNKWACQNIDYQAGLVKYFYNGYFDDQRNSAGIYVENFFELEKSKRQTEEPPIISYGGEQLSNRTFISTGCAVSAIGRTEEEETVKVHIRPMEDFLYNIPYLLVATKGDKNTLYLKNNFYSSHSTPNGFQMNYILKKDKQTIKKGNKYIQETYGVSNDKVSMKCGLLNDIYTLQIKYTYKASKKFLADEIKAIKKKYPK